MPEITVPRTLEDPRKLVSTPPPIEDDASLGGDSQSDMPVASVEQRSKALDLVTGRKTAHDASADRQRSAQPAPKSASAGPQATAANAALASVESVRNLGNTLNPLKGLSAMSSFRGFGRSSVNASPTPSLHGHSPAPSDSNIKLDPSGLDVMGVGAPVQKFVDCKEAKELNFFDVDLLLRDYQRLAGVLRALQTSAAPREDGPKRRGGETALVGCL